MQPVFLMIGGVLTGLAIGRREFTLLLIGAVAIGFGWFNPDASSGLPVPVLVAVAIFVGFILANAFPKRRRGRRWSGASSGEAYTSSSWSDSSGSSSGSSGGSDSGWFGGGESGGGGAGSDWSGGDSGGSDSGGGDSGGGDSGGGDGGGGSSD